MRRPKRVHVLSLAAPMIGCTMIPARREYPKIAQAVRVGAQRGEYTADVGALKGIGYLHAEKTEADIPQLPKT